jgi:hypothetical protein
MKISFLPLSAVSQIALSSYNVPYNASLGCQFVNTVRECCYTEVGTPDGIRHRAQKCVNMLLQSTNLYSPITVMVFPCFIRQALQTVRDRKSELCDEQIIPCLWLLMENVREVDGIF